MKIKFIRLLIIFIILFFSTSGFTHSGNVMIGFSDGTNIMQEKIVKDIDISDGLGLEMAKIMIDKGALELLKKSEETAFKDEMPQRL